MTYNIIEDNSPYYIRFEYEGLTNLIEYVKGCEIVEERIRNYRGYYHYDYPHEIATTIISMLPMNGQFKFRDYRVSLFITPPGGMCPAHKDGADHRVSFNIPIEINDDKCVTTWYTDDELVDCQISGHPYTRKAVEYYDKPREPVAKFTAKPNEFILFNTDIFHAWNNKTSSNYRKLLTLRVEDAGSMYFEDAKKILFGF